MRTDSPHLVTLSDTEGFRDMFITPEEGERRALAAPEVQKLDVLEEDLLKVDRSSFSPAQLLTWLSERRKVIERRATLRGAMPAPSGGEDL